MRRILLSYPTLATVLFFGMLRQVETVTTPTALIPVFVTGIQPRRVRAVNDLFSADKESPAPKDLGALDSCDKHRNEGEWVAVMVPNARYRARLVDQRLQLPIGHSLVSSLVEPQPLSKASN
ncbi:MAG TPA: hypothetical protein VN284_20715, partial [Rhizobium sp.]|nr:hypothetical protein [Rhizobium sp.]